MNRKVAFVTGAAMGLGKGIAVRLAQDGYDLAINDLDQDRLAETEAEIKALGVDCISLVGDVGDSDRMKECFDALIEKYSRIDVLVNNAGTCPVRSILDVTPADFARTMQINFESMYTCSYYAIPYMIKQGNGKIINAGSQASFTQSPIQSEYCTSKWAIRGLTRSLASAVAKYNITVNAYCPGFIDTPIQDKIGIPAAKLLGQTLEQYQAEKQARIPLGGKWQTVEDISSFVSYLASPAGDNITGQNIMINGGIIMN